MSQAIVSALLFWGIHQVSAIPYPSLSDTTQTHASTSISTTNSSTIQFEPRWRTGPQTRGTLGLVFSCCITLFLCVWTTIHVNIEPPRSKFNATLARVIPIPALKKNKTVLRFLAKRWIRKLGWGCFTLLVPEGVLAIATYENKTATLLLVAVNKIIDEHGHLEGEPKVEKWDLGLAYYAVMGGFVLSKHQYLGSKDTSFGANNRATPAETEDVVESPETISTKGNTITQTTTQAITGDPETQAAKNDGLNNRPLTLTPYGVLQLAKWQWPPRPAAGVTTELAPVAEDNVSTNELTPEDMLSTKTNLLPITTAQVKDKSNANALAKGIVLWQALWMIVQVIGRKAGGLPVTLLELHICLHTFCAFVMYVTWWSKPLDIEMPTTVNLSPDQIRFLRRHRAAPDPTNPFAPRPRRFHKSPAPDSEKGPQPAEEKPPTEVDVLFLTSRSGIGKLLYINLCKEKSIRQHYFDAISAAYVAIWKGRWGVWREGLIISFVGLVFGGVHLAAWNFVFPSDLERILWKVASLITATAWLGFVLSLWMSIFVEGNEQKKIVSKVCGVFVGVGIFPVVLVRVYLLAESFASVRKLPLGSYELSVWSDIWPHAT